MGVIYVTREGETNGAVDIEVGLTTAYSDTAPGPVIVPEGKTKLKQLIVAFGDLSPTAADKGAAYLLRLSGPGLVDNEQQFVVGAAFSVFTTAGDTGWGALNAKVFDVDIDVKAGATIAMYVMQSGGVDLGTPTTAITLGFV